MQLIVEILGVLCGSAVSMGTHLAEYSVGILHHHMGVTQPINVDGYGFSLTERHASYICCYGLNFQLLPF